MEQRRSSKRYKTVQFKTIHFVVLSVICVVILLIVMIPQRLQINEAQSLLEQRQQELIEIKRSYEQERRNLDYMQTDEYKIQQGLLKYGWHYPADQIIRDEAANSYE